MIYWFLVRRSKIFLKLVVLLAILAGGFALWNNINAIEDWAKLRNYTPSSKVTALATQTTMTPYATRLFYVNHPALYTDTVSFRSQCSENEQTIVLGCYKAGENGISVYDVQDSRLQGIAQVTAAHEMLHGAYERLSTSDRQSVDTMLQNYYDNDLHDQRIKDTINDYKQTEPNDLLNEMHSIFGTEISNLPVNLENYYKQYFTNRSAVAAYAQKYQGEFNSRSEQIKSYDAQLEALKSQIGTEEASLNQQLAQLNSDRDRLDTYKQNQDFSQYNAAVPDFNQSVDAYNSGVRKLKADISRYNDLVNTRNAVAADLKGLDTSIDTRLTTETTQ